MGGFTTNFGIGPTYTVTTTLPGGAAVWGPAGAVASFVTFVVGGFLGYEGWKLDPNLVKWMQENGIGYHNPLTGESWADASGQQYTDLNEINTTPVEASQESWDKWLAEHPEYNPDFSTTVIGEAPTAPVPSAPTPPPVAPAMPVPNVGRGGRTFTGPNTTPAAPATGTILDTQPPSITPDTGVGDPFPQDLNTVPNPLDQAPPMSTLEKIWRFIKSPRGKALIQLVGGAAGGLMGYKLSQPSAAAKQAIEQILASDTFNAEQVQALMGMMPELMDIYKESVPRARLQLDNATKTVDRASELFDAADAQFNRAEEAYQPALDYGTALLKGGPTAMQAISPEVSAVRSQGEQFRSQLSQLAPRGGGRAMTLMQLPGQEQQQITNLLSQARQFGAELVPKVAAGLGDLAVGRTGLGQGVTNLAGTQGDLARTEAAIGQIAGQLGMSAAELAARWQQIRLYGPQSILDYDIRNRMLQLPIMQAGGQAGGNIAGSLYDIIFDGDGGGGGRSRGGSIIGTPDFNPNATNSPNPYNPSVIDLTDLYSRKGTNSASRTTYGGGGR